MLRAGGMELRLSAPTLYREAVFSEDRVHRYRLHRWWGAGPSILFVMLNPSTADESIEDPTIRRCIGFAKQWGFGCLEIGNLFALRSTDPRGLRVAHDPIGPGNDEWLARLAGVVNQVVVAWGAWPGAKASARAATVMPLLGPDALCLGLTAGGYPRHPLYVAGDTIPLRYQEAREVFLPSLDGR